MHKVIDIDLEGQPRPFRVHEDAYDALSNYLEEARSRVTDDADPAEVMGDLERSIGSKLQDRLGTEERVVTLEDIQAILAAVGPVGPIDQTPAPIAPALPHRRRLYRIREGQQIYGVCTGLSAYSEIDVAWVRTIFFFASFFTAGLFVIVYLAMAFILPVVPTRDAWVAALDERA